jgi:hypothetical protein
LLFSGLRIVRKAGEQLVIRSSRLALFKEIDAVEA